MRLCSVVSLGPPEHAFDSHAGSCIVQVLFGGTTADCTQHVHRPLGNAPRRAGDMRVARVELASALAVAAIVTVVAALAVVRTRHAALGATQHQGPAYTHLHAARHLAAAASPGSQAFLFVGGLQRSGTTWLEALVSSSETSALSFENMDLGEYVRLQPWRLQNHTQSYFEMVARVGGVEGKFVQDVYPYTYLVRDVGRDGHTIDSLLPASQAAAPDAAARLFKQWSVWWDTSKQVLLEKTPENLVMGPFLQSAFGAHRTRFVFVMRHPLVWALAIEKWIFPEFGALRSVEDRIAFWFDCMSRAASQLPQLRDAILLQLEPASVSADVQLAVARHIFCRDDAANRSTARIDGSSGILSSSLAYVTCWLSGQEFRASARRCGPRKSYRDPAFSASKPDRLGIENGWRLHQIMVQREVQANQYGYTFKPFLKLTKLPVGAVQRVRLNAVDQVQQLGVVTNNWLRVRSSLRPYLVVPPPGAKVNSFHTPPPPPPAFPATKHVLVVYHKMGSDKEKPTGMDMRMDQIVGSLVALQMRVHFLCQCDVDPSQLSPFGYGVAIYFGTLEQQYNQATSATRIDVAYVFFTTLTMSVHQRQLSSERDWYLEPAEPLPEERVVSWLRKSTDACIAAVADDIHYLRAAEVLGHLDAERAAQASIWIRRRELAFHESVHSVLTVSLEDAASLRSVLPLVTAAPDCRKRCSCSLLWVPYTHEAVQENAVQPFSQRSDGMLYVGGMHGLAVKAMQWLVQDVQPLIARSSPNGKAALQSGGTGHLYLVGPGWESHVNELGAINRAVQLGHVTILGTLTDVQLNRQLSQLKVFVAPVFNGTGIATKNVMAMSSGIPLVTTPVGLQGLGLPTGQTAVLTADTPEDFARSALGVQTSPEHFEASWRGALAHTKQYLSAQHQEDVLCGLMKLARRETVPRRREDAPICSFGSSHGRTPLTTAGAVVQSTIAPSGNSSSAVVVLGLGGSGAPALAKSLQGSRVCLVPEPLKGMERASMAAQLDHLRSLLLEPAYCAVRHLPLSPSQRSCHTSLLASPHTARCLEIPPPAPRSSRCTWTAESLRYRALRSSWRPPPPTQRSSILPRESAPLSTS